MLQSLCLHYFISMFFVMPFSGLMIASQASPIGQSFDPAALYVSLYSIANSSGRFIWGSLIKSAVQRPY